MDGVLVVDKPAGPTSHDIVDRVRRVLGQKRVGHTGTLDPFATGVLPLCIGKATRLARFLSAGEKRYRAQVRLGFATSTDDLTGEPLAPPCECRVSRAAVETAAAGLVGSFDQVPPAFSAKRVGGRRLYELARRGEALPRPASPVTVHAIEVLALEGDRLELDVRCSPGTYVRALARDLGAVLEVGAHLVALRRTRSGDFTLEQAVSGDELHDCARQLIPLARLLPELQAVCVPASARPRVKNGRDLGPGDVTTPFSGATEGRVRLVDEEGRLLALASVCGAPRGGNELPSFPVLHPEIVFLD